MKKFLSLILVLIILSTSMTAFADIEERLGDHWSKDMIEKDFVALYFPDLARKNFEKLDPSAPINNKIFSLSLGSLAKDYELGSISNSIILSKTLTRKEVVKIIGNRLKDIEDLKAGNKEHPFKDINTMDNESIELLRLLFNLEIINGVSNNEFAPDNVITQAEAIIILQRVKGVLDAMNQVSFTTKGIVQSYNNQETVIVKEVDDKVLVTITKQFSTPGYNLSVDKIVKDDGNKHQIYLDITPPPMGTILPQVITYKTITLEIEATELKGESPYIFTVEGIKSNLLR